jgi:phosphoribosylformimino-5-aminoimidazole carboxamide ribotide isomerase
MIFELNMKIIPVMDLLDRFVVLGKAGKRNEYRPIENSVVTKSAIPLEVAEDFKNNFELNTFYIADLNLIQKTENMNINKEEISKIVNTKSFSLMVDGGCSNIADVSNILDLGIDQAIIGTETLASISDLETIVDNFNSQKIILSIDLMGGKLLTTNDKLKRYTLVDLVEIVDSLSLYAMIILDLQKVGSQSGPMNTSLETIIKKNPTTNIITGGGVRNVDDLITLQENHISGALIATAFHNGNITKKDLDLLN